MRRLGWSSLVVALVLVTGATAVDAQSTSRRAAQERVFEAQQSAEALYQAFPRLREVDAVVRRDCAEKNRGNEAGGAFCSCASAVTMSLWRSGIDPQMVPRLQTFLNTPDASAESFAAYQGPELYGPLCRIAAR